MTDAYSQFALPPATIVQEYEVKQVLGVGSFAIVYEAENKFFRETVALKEFLPTDLACREESSRVVPLSSETEASYKWALNKFLEEARMLRELVHPQPHRNIVRVRQFIEANDTAYMVMDYEEGNLLSKILKERGPLPEADLREILEPLMEGLERVHAAPVWHRDIKPSNILIRPDGSPVLIDFGAARREMPGAVRSVMSVYTPAYAAPEQVQAYGDAEHGPWTDIYAFGATLYRAVTGTKPTNAAERLRGAAYAPAVQAAEGIYSQGLLKAIDAALELKPESRPQSIGEWRHLLNEPEEDDSTVLRDTAQNGSNIDALKYEVESALDSPSKEKAEPVSRDVGPNSAKNIAANPIDFESDLEGLAKQEAEIDPGRKEIKTPPGRDKGDTRPKGASNVLFSKWALIAGVALISIIMLLWMNIPKKVDQVVDSPAKKAMEIARDAAVSARDHARSADAEKINSYLQARSHFDTGEKRFAAQEFEAAAESFSLARQLFEQTLKEIEESRLDARSYNVKVSSDGYVTKTEAVELRAGEDNTVNITLEEEPQTGRLFVKTVPQGATVRIVGIEEEFQQGIQLDARSYNVKVSADGYVTKTEAVELRAGEDNAVNITLEEEPQTGRLFVTTVPQGATVRIVGIEEEFQQGIQLDARSYNVKVSSDGYVTKTEAFELRAGEDNTVNITLEEEPQTGRLFVKTVPEGATVRILNMKPQFYQGMQLDAGSYHVEVSADGYSTQDKWAEIHTGEKKYVNIKLVKKGRLFVKTVPEGATVRILNMKPKFHQGMQLDAGRYHVEVSADCYSTQDKWAEIRTGEITRVSIRVKPTMTCEMPNVRKIHIDEAKKRLIKAGFVEPAVKVVVKKIDVKKAKPGTVIEQIPSAGERVQTGETILLLCQTGQKRAR